MSSVPYRRAQITHWLGSHTVAKARGYVNAVSGLRWRHQTLSGEVKGSARHPYVTAVHFYDSENGLWIESECTCPVRYDCKHAAAVLAAGLETFPPDLAPTPAPAPVSAPVRTPSPVPVAPPPPAMRPELASWLESFREQRATARPDTKKAAARPTQALAYVLIWVDHRQRHEVQLYKVALGRDGALGARAESWSNVEAALVRPPRFVTTDDLTLLRGLWLGRSRGDHGVYALSGADGADVLSKLVASQRFFVARGAAPMYGHLDLSANGPALVQGSARPGRIVWQTQPDERVRPVVETDPESTLIIATEPSWYVDTQRGEAGIVTLPMSFASLRDYLSMPPISLAEAPLVAAVLRESAPDLPLPPAHDTSAIHTIDTEPVPVLSLDTRTVHAPGRGYRDPRGTATPVQLSDFATVRFDYAGTRVEADDARSLFVAGNGDVTQIKRRLHVEKQRLLELRKAGLEKIVPAYAAQPFSESIWGLPGSAAWPVFVDRSVPVLRDKGWRIDMGAEFRFNVVEIDTIDGMARHTGDGWFDLEMGITLGDRAVRLEPLLADLFRRDPRWLSGALDGIADDEAMTFTTDEGDRLRVRADRLKPIVRVLADLFDAADGGADGALLRVMALDAGRLDALDGTGRWQFQGDAAIRERMRHLRTGSGLREVPVPKGLKAELRVYQREGLNWMQFLREQDLAGILADDMGLGKTLQTLAHVLAEKEAGRLDRPALIIVPTTLVHNWCEEARRFAPHLKVLDLNGPARRDRFDRIGEHDLVLTTYALLWRDQDVLAGHDYHLLILDEAQYVKNATTKAAATIRALHARHRLCLTGTPLENHLGELWSQFDFLLPGFLGTRKDFTKRWRTPIEKGGDTVRRDLLARRIRPFMLRRRKDEVAKELPPKTTIVRTVDLEGAQRDLYETVRAAMHDKVRAAVAEKGLARSHIVVLEALLKLRQVCCDPRLVKQQKVGQKTVGRQKTGTRNAAPAASAKLDLLLTMLPELIDEGRRVLLFSQFTGMLALIGTALEKAAIPYVILTGDTSDRVTPVRRFQQGEVPLFLISLKAGGVGLNLTAADTVIHYDPWWNPAAENQATDRAHRLGQDKPVFVYKLIAAGSIEERIVALQEKKAALANGILSEDAAGAVKFSAADLDVLFEPIPDVGSTATAARGSEEHAARGFDALATDPAHFRR
ncbi:DEAD/DEAH box helicase [Robbsia sp. Bb-Pol-6]|uniref:DEAD/DEAH box helicase n=1 Tax=Robbsia betulipollinis TaxID=2981849 RepID=A0ABT3ZSV9_9BURK|nr:DEAD/DEAH box helicase [Robbsia betulipollinis]MCY0389357.1 DEAD/DEAH box helicase [Robbsia betulipollinis]